MPLINPSSFTPNVIGFTLGSALPVTPSTIQSMTGFSFSMSDNQKYTALLKLHCTGGSGFGLKFGVTTPGLGSGSMRLSIFGKTTGAAIYGDEAITASGTLSTTVFVNGSTLSGIVYLVLNIQIIGSGAGAGTVQFGFANSAGGSTAQVNANSSMQVIGPN